jgi:hypothetical protein
VKRTVCFVTLGLLFAGITMSAQQAPWSLSFAQPWVPPGATGDTRIMGTVIDIRQVPVANVKVQLRNLESGMVVDSTQTDDNGDYQFDIKVPSSYVVEMVLVDGYVIALSNAGSVARFETLQTVIQLPGRWDSIRQNVMATQPSLGFLGMSSQTTMTVATMLIAANQDISPVDAGEPVSPR